MFRFFSLPAFVIISFAFSGCSKNDPEIAALTGTYSGTFYYHSPSTSSSNPVAVTFSGNSYASTSNSNRIPAGGSGYFQVSNQQVQFKDINIWTADFDWGLILNGNYTSQIKGDSLILNKTNLSTSYQYRLKRTN